MEKREHETVNHSEGQNKMKGNEAAIILDGQATTKVPSEPSLMERTKEVMEDIGSKLNGI